MALRLNASSDLLSTGTAPPSGDVTACFWTKQVSIRSSGTYTLLWGLGNNTQTASNAFALYMNFSGGLELYGPPTGTLLLTTAAVTAGPWNFVAVRGHTGASQAWAVVVNGTTTTGTSSAGGGYVSDRVDLGACGNTSTVFSDATYAAYKQWSAQLTDDEMQAERRSYLPQRWGNLWAFTPGLTAGNVTDYSGQGNGFTVTGSIDTEDGPPIAWLPRQVRSWGQVAAAAAGAGILRQMLQHAG